MVARSYPPVLEHLSFRLGNQLFFIRVEDVDEIIPGPGSMRGLLSVSKGSEGHACILPMKKNFFGKGWSATQSGWGLLDANDRKPVNPVELITDKKIEMNRWELHDFAVQVVRGQLEKDGYELISWQGNPDVDPSIWFIGASKSPEWIVVRAVRYPDDEAERPSNWTEIANRCTRMSNIGHFASVSFASKEDSFDPTGKNVVPLFRGHGVHIRYQGLN